MKLDNFGETLVLLNGGGLFFIDALALKQLVPTSLLILRAE